MTVLRRRFLLSFGLFLALPALPLGSAHAQGEVVVRIVTDAATGQPRYDPSLVRIQPGDTVVFANRGHVHASRTVPGMHPPEAELWWGQVGEDIRVTFTVPGVYGHKCGGSYRQGLIGLVVVGDPSPNLEAARAVAHPPAAAKRLDALFAELTAPN
jgi:pseudoazurin